MCIEVWYRFTCTHLKPAAAHQEGWRRCSAWTGGNEVGCRGHDPNADHETRDVDTVCEECAYITPSTSSGSSAGDSGGE
ncbi:hypothetical protein GGS24DRAFT_447097 [Hypoxylon argillaceum]|nr:hypothetical protein GGS24DRAFT_447097 [Hypoxylon argillaceum]